MKYLFPLILILASIACVLPVSDSGAILARSNNEISRPASDGSAVTVTAQFVNIRDADGIATGEIAQAGDVLTVTFRPDGYALISSPAKWAGMLIWRGCTSDNGGYGCEAK